MSVESVLDGATLNWGHGPILQDELVWVFCCVVWGWECWGFVVKTCYKCPILLADFYQGCAFWVVLSLGRGGGSLEEKEGYGGIGTTKSIALDNHKLKG